MGAIFKKSRGQCFARVLGAIACAIMLLFVAQSWRSLLCKYLLSELRSSVEPQRSNLLEWLLYFQPKERRRRIPFASSLRDGIVVNRVFECSNSNRKNHEPIIGVVIKDPDTETNHEDDEDASSARHYEYVIFTDSSGMVLIGTIWDQHCADINGDGAYECIYCGKYKLSTYEYEALTVTSVSESLESMLWLVFNYDETVRRGGGHSSSWRMERSTQADVFNIALVRDTGEGDTQRVVYSWSEAEFKYGGPKGSFDQNFVRIDSQSEFDHFRSILKAAAAGGSVGSK